MNRRFDAVRVLGLLLLGLALTTCDGEGGAARDAAVGDAAPAIDAAPEVVGRDLVVPEDTATVPEVVVPRELMLMTFNLRTMFGDAAPTSAEVVTTSFDGHYPSDHFPVTATYTLP